MSIFAMKGKSKGKGKAGKTRAPFACWNCNDPNHRASECPKPLAAPGGQTKGGGKLNKGGKETSTTWLPGKGKGQWTQWPWTYLPTGKGYTNAGAYAMTEDQPPQPEADTHLETEESIPMWNLSVDCPIRPPQRAIKSKPVELNNRFAALANHPIDFIELEYDLNNVSREEEWKLVETTIDSGAARSVCPTDFCKQFPVRPSVSSKKNECFRTATGMRVKNEGERIVHGTTPEGPKVNMKYAVADIAVPLESVSQICDGGATVTFTREGGHIDGPAGRIHFQRRGDTYLRTTWVRSVPPTPSQGASRTTSAQIPKAPWTLSTEVVKTAPDAKPPSVFRRPGKSP